MNAVRVSADKTNCARTHVEVISALIYVPVDLQKQKMDHVLILMSAEKVHIGVKIIKYAKTRMVVMSVFALVDSDLKVPGSLV